MKNKYRVEDFNPQKWFKVVFASRKVIDYVQEVHVCYTYGDSVKQVTEQAKSTGGIGWIVSDVKEVNYDQMIRQIERSLEKEYQ